MCSVSKEQSILSRETIQNAFFCRILPLFQLRKTLIFCNISRVIENYLLKLRVCVHYPKSNPYIKEDNSKFTFFRIMPLFRLYIFWYEIFFQFGVKFPSVKSQI